MTGAINYVRREGRYHNILNLPTPMLSDWFSNLSILVAWLIYLLSAVISMLRLQLSVFSIFIIIVY